MIEADVLKLDGLRHGFFTREGGVSDGIYKSLNIGLGSDDQRTRVVENRARVAGALGVTADCLVSPHQVHSPEVIIVERPWQDGDDRQADALVTNTPGLAIGVATADCGPVLFADPEAGVIGAAHSGWKGAISGVLQNTVAAMTNLGAAPQNIIAVLGPTISQSAYEVGPEFHIRFLEVCEGHARHFTPSGRDGHFLFDLPAFITSCLRDLDLSGVENLNLCTYAEETRFFSYRRATHRKEPDYGRQISAISLDTAP